MEIVLVRHAESTSNVSRRWQGQGDAPLSEHGVAQAALLERRLAARRRAGWSVDLVIASDLQRASSTARASFAAPLIDASWREADVGAWEGLTREEVAARFPLELAALAEGRRDVSLGGGESLERFWARVDGALAQLRERLPADGRAVVFTHGGVIGAAIAGVLGKRETRASLGLARLANTAMTTLHFDAHHPRGRVLSLNDTAHLGAGAVAAEERRDGAMPLVRLVADAPDALGVHADANDALGVASEASRALAAADGSREAIVAALQALVAGVGGADVTLHVAPRVVHAIVVALAHIPAERHSALIEPPHTTHTHIALDPRFGALVVDHACLSEAL